MAGSWRPEPSDDLLPVLHKEAVPLDLPQTGQTRRWEGFRKGVVAWWKRFVCGYAWHDIERLKEAKLRETEGLGEERMAAAEAKRAEARRLDAEAERLHAEAEQIRLANLEKRLSIEEAYSRLQEAIQAIEANGGRVEFGIAVDDVVEQLPSPRSEED